MWFDARINERSAGVTVRASLIRFRRRSSGADGRRRKLDWCLEDAPAVSLFVKNAVLNLPMSDGGSGGGGGGGSDSRVIGGCGGGGGDSDRGSGGGGGAWLLNQTRVNQENGFCLR